MRNHPSSSSQFPDPELDHNQLDELNQQNIIHEYNNAVRKNSIFGTPASNHRINPEQNMRQQQMMSN